MLFGKEKIFFPKLDVVMYSKLEMSTRHFFKHLHTFSQIHLWRNTCQPFNGQHDSWSCSLLFLGQVGGSNSSHRRPPRGFELSNIAANDLGNLTGVTWFSVYHLLYYCLSFVLFHFLLLSLSRRSPCRFCFSCAKIFPHSASWTNSKKNTKNGVLFRGKCNVYLKNLTQLVRPDG